MVIKVCLSIFCNDRNIDRWIATYTDHIKIMSYWWFEEHVSCWKFQNCFYMLHKDAYKVHLISGSFILQFTVAIIFVRQTYVVIFYFVRQK